MTVLSMQVVPMPMLLGASQSDHPWDFLALKLDMAASFALLEFSLSSHPSSL